MIVDILLGAVVPLILLIVAGYLIKTFRNNEVIKWVGIAVKAAEQIFEHGMNTEKFTYVSEWISKKLLNVLYMRLKPLLKIPNRKSDSR